MQRCAVVQVGLTLGVLSVARRRCAFSRRRPGAINHVAFGMCEVKPCHLTTLFRHQLNTSLWVPRYDAADTANYYERPQAIEHGQREGRRHAYSSMPPPKSTSYYWVRGSRPLLSAVVGGIKIQCFPPHMRYPQSHTGDDHPGASSCASRGAYHEQMP
jgi:hypothetical protein